MRTKIILLIILLFIIAGCDSGNEQISRDLYQGTQGVMIDVFDLPREVNENENIPLVVKVENKGPYESSGYLVVSTEGDYMGVKGYDNHVSVAFQLKGKTIMNDIDDFEIFNIPLYAKNLDPLSEVHDTYLTMYTCYGYKGLAYADVCVDPDPYDVGDAEKACKVQTSISLSEGQGGPVVIDRIEPKMLIEGDIIRPQFKIYIQNRGRGTVIQKNSLAQVCSKDSLDVTTYNTLSLSEVEISGRKLSAGQIECIPRVLQLKKEQDFVTCTINSGSGISRNMLAYESPLKIQIDYGYTESITKEISIKKILTY